MDEGCESRRLDEFENGRHSRFREMNFKLRNRVRSRLAILELADKQQLGNFSRPHKVAEQRACRSGKAALSGFVINMRVVRRVVGAHGFHSCTAAAFVEHP